VFFFFFLRMQFMNVFTLVRPISMYMATPLVLRRFYIQSTFATYPHARFKYGLPLPSISGLFHVY